MTTATPSPLVDITLTVNGREVTVRADPATPLLYLLRNDLGLVSPKPGCAQEQCYACAVLVDGKAVPACNLAAGDAAGLTITTLEGLGTPDALHPLQECFVEEQAIQCGYCAAGMIVAAQSLLNQIRYPTDEQIRQGMATNLCRCGVYDRVRRAIRLRIGRPDPDPLYEVRPAPPLPPGWIPPADDPISPSLQRNPHLDDWLRIDPAQEGTVTVLTGKVEIGQGIKTALAQLAAEELDVAMARMRVVDGDTARTPDEGITAGSQSMQSSGLAVRQAAAHARRLLLQLAHEELEAVTPADQLHVEDGVVTDPATGRSTSYWQIFGGRRFGVDVDGSIPPKRPDAHRLVGAPVTRLDLPAKVAGVPSYVQDLALPEMVHGRVVRPPAYAARLLAVDPAPVEAMPGVLAVVQDGSFLAVVAQREEQAVRAAETLAHLARWENPTSLPQGDAIFAHMRAADGPAFPVVDGVAMEGEIPPPVEAPAPAARLEATYYRPFQMHASLGPSSAVAHLEGDRMTVWVQTQGVFPQRAILAHALGMAPANLHVVHVEGAGCYGHNGAEDAALDAALLARALPGRPVALKWSRADEHAWEPYGPAMIMALQADLDDDGQIAAWNHNVWSYTHVDRPRADGERSGLLAAGHLAQPLPPQEPGPRLGHHFGGYRNADPLYALPRRRIVSHFVPESPLRASALRSLGAYGNVFAIESFMDELAHAADVDPVEFRLRHLDDPRARAVVEAAAETAGWSTPLAPPDRPGLLRGRGIGFAQYKNVQCYAAVVVTLTVDPATGAVRLEEAVLAAEAGQVVNPDGLSNQLEGGFLQAASWTLLEEVRTRADGIASHDWETYPVLRFDGAPRLRTVLLNRPALPFLGSGEASIGPTPGAIANAIFAACGVRLRRIPFTAARVLEALGEA